MQPIEKITQKDLLSLIKSKEDFYQIFSFNGSYLVPDPRDLTFSFIRGVLRNEKKLLKIQDIKSFYIPKRYSSISVDALWSVFKHEKEFSQYFPTDASRAPARPYFFAILNSISPNTTQRLLEKVSFEKQEEVPDKNKIFINPQFVNLLENNDVPLLSSADKIQHYIKSGRKNRVVTKKQKPKYVPPLEILKKDLMELE